MAASGARDGISAFRASHERLRGLVADLDEPALSGPSHADEWTVGQVLSHLGSQAEIMDLFLEAGATGAPAPDRSLMPPVWDRWNAMSPTEWRDLSLAANERSIARLESLDDAAAEAFELDFFGMPLDLAGFVALRLSEHAVHAWDVEVALDPQARVADDAVAIIVDQLGRTAARGGKGSATPYRVRVQTRDPERDVVIAVGESVSLAPVEPGAADDYDGVLRLPAEELVRLVYGRLGSGPVPDAEETGSRGLADLRAAFPGV